MTELKSKSIPTWETLSLPVLVVGDATKGFHADDTVYWRFLNVGKFEFIYKKIYAVESNGIIFLESGLLPLGTVVKIGCPHKK